MAKVQAPCLSLGATGSIGGILTFSRWKGIKTARQKSNPSNPNTVAQQAQRGIFASCVDFWRTTLTAAATKTGWNAQASQSGKPQSGFNAFTSNAVAILRALATGSIATSIANSALNEDDVVLTAALAAIDGGGVPAAAPSAARVAGGNAAGNMINSAPVATPAAAALAMDGTDMSAIGEGNTIYYQFYSTQGGIETAISGIHSAVLIAAS